MTKQIHEPESNPFYHNTLKLLKNYRDVVWNLEISGSDLQSEFRAQYGSNLDECLNGLEAAGVSLAGTRIEGFARSLERSRKMLQLVNNAIQLMREKHKRGELYYWILFYSYLSPKEYGSVADILAALEAHFSPLSSRTFYIRREEAIKTLSSILWGYTSSECQDILKFFDFSGQA